MTITQRLVEAPPSLRWHTSRAVTAVVRRRAFMALGTGTVLVSPAVIKNPGQISIGSHGAIFDGVRLQCESLPQSRIVIGDRANFGHHVQIHSFDPVRIGDDCLIGFGSLVSSGDHDYPDRHQTIGTGPITIGDNVFIGHGAVVLGGVTVGDGATIGANAVVTKDVPAGAVWVGNPGRAVGQRA